MERYYRFVRNREEEFCVGERHVKNILSFPPAAPRLETRLGVECWPRIAVCGRAVSTHTKWGIESAENFVRSVLSNEKNGIFAKS